MSWDSVSPLRYCPRFHLKSLPVLKLHELFKSQVQFEMSNLGSTWKRPQLADQYGFQRSYFSPVSPSFIIIFLNHLVSSAGPEPTDLSSCSCSSGWTANSGGGAANTSPAWCDLAQSETEVLNNTEVAAGRGSEGFVQVHWVRSVSM